MTEQSPPDVRFRQGCLALFLMIFVVCAIVFTIAALDEQVLLSLSEQRRGSWLRWFTVFEFGGANIAAVLFVLYLLYEIAKYGWQALSPVAVGVRSDTVLFHPTLRQKPLALSEIRSVDHETPKLNSFLRIRTHSHGIIVVKQVDEDSAEAFAKAINAVSSEA